MRVLVVEDEVRLAATLQDLLELNGYTVDVCHDGEAGLDNALTSIYDVILLDVMLPKRNGYEIVHALRKGGDKTPVLMLTARTEEVDTVLGLELGADDYVTKPFSMRELMARVRANLRRSAAKTAQEETGGKLVCGAITVDPEHYEADKNGQPLELTLRELELLKFLMYQRGQIFSREYLLEKVWGYEYYGDARTVDVTVRRLREKIEDVPGSPEYILTKRGVGYYFTDKDPV